MIKKIKNNIGMLLLIVTIVTFNFIIGANEKGLRIESISILMGLIIMYLIIIKIKHKEQSVFFKGKIDYLVLAFMLTTTLPLIFKTYASYSDTVEFIMKYSFIYSIYILARNVIKKKRDIEIIITVTLISALIPIILEVGYNINEFIKKFVLWLNVHYTKSGPFHSTLGYGNAQAVYSALCIFLAMHKFKVHQNKLLKAINIIYIVFSLYIIYIAESRAVMLILVIVFLVLFIVKFKEQIVKYKKQILIFGCVSSLLGVVFINITLNFSKPIIKDNEDIEEYLAYNFEKNKKYKLEMNIYMDKNGSSNIDSNDAFEIEIKQRGPYFRKSTIASAKSCAINGNYSIEFVPTQDINHITINIKNIFGGKIRIDDFFINGEKQIVNYRFLPNNIGNFFSKLYIGGKSKPQRMIMYKDSLKIAFDSPIIGNGGNVWKNVSRAVEEYKVKFKECHSYFLELLISYGIIGLILFLAIIIVFFVKIFKLCKNDKEKRKDKIVIAIGLLVVILHCMVDFDMSFMIIQILVYIYMAVLLFDNKEQEEVKITKRKNILEHIIIVCLVFVVSLYVRADVAKCILKDKDQKHSLLPYKKEYYYEKILDDKINNKNYVYILNEFQDYIEKEPYYTQNLNYKYYFELICENLENLSIEELNKYLNFGIYKLKNVKVKLPFYFDSVINRQKVMVSAINSLNKYARENEIDYSRKIIINKSLDELKELVYKEYEKNKKNIEDFERHDMSNEETEKILKEYQALLDTIK